MARTNKNDTETKGEMDLLLNIKKNKQTKQNKKKHKKKTKQNKNKKMFAMKKV